MIHVTLASDLASGNLLRFRNNLLERISKLIMRIDDKTRDKELLCDINRNAVKISALISNKTYKYEYLIGEETLPLYQKGAI